MHTWSAEAHDAFTVQTPFVHVSVALQQGTAAEQLWLVAAHARDTCNNGGGCNPPGNICGASTSTNASQD